MERQTSGNLKEFYSAWRSKHGEWIVGSSTIVALAGGGIAVLAEEPVGGLRFTVGAYAFSVGIFMSTSVLWEAGRAGYRSIRESIRERRSPQVLSPK